MKKIVFTGGGSAGHVLPNVALIQELKKENFDLYYFGSNAIEKSIVAETKIPFYTLSAPKLKRGFGFEEWKNNLALPKRFFAAVRHAVDGLNTVQPDLVFSKGGYVALPVVFAAAKLHIPCLAHESDLSPGLANRLSKNMCTKILTAFPETASAFKNGEYCGQPIRGELFGCSRADARRILTNGTTLPVLLVFGGGSGSSALNNAVRNAAPALTKKYFVLHVCGKNNTLDCRLKNYRQFEFIQDMGMAYAAADVVVCRSGAGAAFECLALKKPTVFVPLEGQTRGDQWENAEYFLRRGLCYLLPQKRLHRLCDIVDMAFADDSLREKLLTANYSSGTNAVLYAIRRELNRL
jgi:UDP-N-acetylglucosamine--N-acetylmuramyl-(pentapeptide) pyrophosphoryl-undecaprenol N-acetylglucosamine transferase